MIRVAKYTEAFDRLIALDHDGDEADAEFDRLSRELLGIDLDDISQADFDRLWLSLSTEHEAISVCRDLGFDLVISGNTPVTCWQELAVLIVAKSEGLIPDDPLERAERRLAIERDDFTAPDDE